MLSTIAAAEDEDNKQQRGEGMDQWCQQMEWVKTYETLIVVELGLGWALRLRPI